MIRKRSALVYALSATLAMLSIMESARAGCNANNPAGTWHLMGMQAATPDIKSTTVTVKDGSNLNTQIKVFQNVANPYDNTTAGVFKCVLTVNGAGDIQASPCIAYSVDGTLNLSTVTGNLELTSCNLSGKIKAPGDTAVTIREGHINGTSGAGIATQGPKRVLYFTLIKN